MICNKCGKELLENELTCPECETENNVSEGIVIVEESDGKLNKTVKQTQENVGGVNSTLVLIFGIVSICTIFIPALAYGFGTASYAISNNTSSNKKTKAGVVLASIGSAPLCIGTIISLIYLLYLLFTLIKFLFELIF